MLTKFFKVLLIVALTSLPYPISQQLGLLDKPSFLKVILYAVTYALLFRFSKSIWSNKF